MSKRKVVFVATVFAVGLIWINPILFGLLPLPQSLIEMIAVHNIRYLPGYSVEKHNMVQEGMTKEEVIALIGEPYGGMPESPFCPNWVYERPRYLVIPPFAGDYYHKTAQVCFNEQSLVRYPKIEHIFFD